MSQTIYLRHIDHSSLKGQEQKFEQAEVTIGRRPGCEVRFDAQEDTSVSGHHAKLAIEDGKLVLHDLGATNGTFVDGVKVTEPVTIHGHERIALGANGPTFVAQLMTEDAAAAPATLVDDSPKGFGLDVHDDQFAPPSPAGVGAGMGAVGAGAAPPKRAVGVNTLFGLLEENTQRERKRMFMILGPAAGVLLLIVGITVWSLSGGGNGGGGAAEPPTRVKDAVYLVVKRSKVGENTVEHGSGTAWSVKEGIFATNAHVAALFFQLKPGEELFVRSPTKPHRDLRITKVEQHPGYGAFYDLVNKYRPVDIARVRQRTFMQPCDVALMWIHEDDVDHQNTPLNLASDSTLRAMKPGDKIWMFGYPMEGMIGGGVNVEKPTPILKDTTISKVTDTFLAEDTKHENNIQFTYGTESAGGASGSAVVNADGEVIGLLASGNVLGWGEGGERISSGDVSYGPRVDLVRELLDGTAMDNQQARTARWQEAFAAMHEGWTKDPKVAALVHIYSLLPGDRQPKLAVVKDWTMTVQRGRQGAQTDPLIRINKGARYFVCVLPHDEPQEMHVARLMGPQWRMLTQKPTRFPTYSFDLRSGEVAGFRVFLPDEAERSESKVTVVLLIEKPERDNNQPPNGGRR